MTLAPRELARYREHPAPSVRALAEHLSKPLPLRHLAAWNRARRPYPRLSAWHGIERGDGAPGDLLVNERGDLLHGEASLVDIAARCWPIAAEARRHRLAAPHP